MSQGPSTATLPLRAASARGAATSRPRRSLLVPAVLISAGVHLAVAAMLWIEQPPQPEAGTAVAVEIVPEAGVVSASRARPNSAANPGGNHAPAARPAAVPEPQPPSEPPPPRPSSEPPATAAPSALPPPRQAMTAPEIVAESPTVRPPLRRPREARPAPTRTPTVAAPNPPMPKLAQAKTPPNRAGTSPARPQTASVPIVAADIAPGSGPDSGATPPRYGFGSAANPIPRYPEDARERGWEGVVVLTVSVGADGRAESVRVSRGSGHAVLDIAALDAVRRWRFEPARRAGMPVAAAVDVPIRFRLED